MRARGSWGRAVDLVARIGPFLFVACAARSAPAADEPEARAIAYLGREVPRWSRENRCFSCHNNGDGARALLASRGTPFAPKGDGLDATLAFLDRPDRWERNGGDAAFHDGRLARLQFASTLDAAVGAGRIADRAPLRRAAELLAKDQAEDGSWPIDDAAPVGSPATYGPHLATALAIRTLRRTDGTTFRESIARAEHWLQEHPPRNVPEAAALLLALNKDEDRARRDAATGLLRRAQNEDGGWGPFPRSASEPFDSALAILALSPDKEARDPVRRGRAFLIANQQADGSWTETTRPAGSESYAQRISTSAWATMALLTTRPELRAADRPRS